jgi:hypothetical protein
MSDTLFRSATGKYPNFLLNQTAGLIFCSPSTAYPVTDGCNTNAYSANGNFSGTFTSSVVDTTVGATLNPEVEFDLTLHGVYWEGSTTADFLDPATLSFLATDPTTGALLSGVTVTGDSGTVYSVNAITSIPEPSALALSASAITFFLCIGTILRKAPRGGNR